MTNGNQERIQQIWAEITQWEAQKSSGVSLQTQEQIDREIKAAKKTITELEAEDQAAENELIQQDHAVRVTSATSQFDDFLDNMDLGGMTFREVIGGVKEYQLVSIELKKGFMSQAEKFSSLMAEQQALHSEQMRGAQERETQMQRQNEILQKKHGEVIEMLDKTRQAMDEVVSANYSLVEKAKEAEITRDNAMKQLDEANQQIAQQKGHIDDLRNELALGARGAINVVDTAEEDRQKKELAEQIRKERTVYNVEWVDEIKRNRKKAKLAATGEEINFPWTEETKFFVIDEAQVPSFREQYAIAITPEVPDVDQKSDEVAETVEEVPQFPKTIIAVPALGPIELPGHTVNVEVQEKAAEEYVTRGELNERLAELESRITGVKVA